MDRGGCRVMRRLFESANTRLLGNVAIKGNPTLSTVELNEQCSYDSMLGFHL